MSDLLEGDCACGGVRFEIEKSKVNIVNCHCNKCRKLNGASYSTYFVVSGKRFNIVSGESLLDNYSPSAKALKYYCRNCGTPVFNMNLKYPNLKMVHYGAINFPEEAKPTMNIFCQNKLSWVELDRNISCYEQEII